MGETPRTENLRMRRLVDAFDDEFKKDAVRLVEQSNLPLRQVAEDLGIPEGHAVQLGR